jgi:adenylate cyclase
VTLPDPLLARLRRRFRVEVSTLILTVVTVHALLLLALGYMGAHSLLRTVGHEAHLEEHARLETEIRSFMASATGAVRALAGSPGQSLSAAGEKRAAELMWTLMSESPVLDALYFAHHDGSLVGIQRHPQPALRRIHAHAHGLREVLEFKPGLEQSALPPNQRFATARTQVRATDYDLRKQPWFHEAVSSMTPHWTAVHSLPFSGESGLTYSAPDGLHDAQGRLDGVAAGDISLRHLGQVVASFSHAGVGESAVLTLDGHVLARSDDERGSQLLERPGAGDVLQAILASVQARAGDPAPVSFGGQAYLVRAGPIPGTPWNLVSWLPEDAVVGGLKKGLVLAGSLLALCLLASLSLSLWLSRRVTRPIEVLGSVARRIGRLDLQDLPRIDSPVEEIHRLDESLAESARSLRALRKFVPADIVHELVKLGRPLEPGGEEVELTVMFTDVEGFTGIAATVAPDRLVPQLTEYFSAVAEVVVRHGGTIDKYIGDGIMVLWGAPAPLPDAPLHAARAALEIQEKLEQCNAGWAARGLPQLHTRIGLHTGPAIAGVLGSAERLSFTAFGDTVNLASRIEGMNKELGTRILASAATAAALQGRIDLRSCGEVELRGRAGRWILYEVRGLSPAS